MVTQAFSLTEKMIIDPVLTLRAPLDPTQTKGCLSSIWQSAQAELAARVVAVFASVFALIDAFIHLFTGLYKAADLLVRNISHLIPAKYSSSDVGEHFQRAKQFFILTLIGSIAGVIWPGLFKEYRYSPSFPPEDFQDAPDQIQQLAKMVGENEETTPFRGLQELWEKSSLAHKHAFVQVFNNNGHNFDTVRKELAPMAYRPITGRRQAAWLSMEEISRSVTQVWKKTEADRHSFFYHATSERSLELILKSKKIEVRHEKAFRGAFVSTQPELGFGRCILALKRNIERLSPLTHGFPMGHNTYWAGFSRDIPVIPSTLAYIILEKATASECEALEERCLGWTGQPIQVVSLHRVADYLESIERLGMGIPKEWNDSEDMMANVIFNTLKARAALEADQIEQVVSVHKEAMPRLVMA